MHREVVVTRVMQPWRIREIVDQQRKEAFAYRGGPIRLAVDVCVGYRAFPVLEGAGVVIAYEAATAEPDEVWFSAALRAGVHAVASADDDLNHLCFRAGVRWLKLPSRAGFRWREQADFILRKLERWGWLR